MPPANIIILMGVSGSGKTTVGRLLAGHLGISFFDGDNYHPHENIEKMRSGSPLDDQDRESWYRSLQGLIQGLLADNVPAVLACSALKARYRACLELDPGRIRWVCLHGSFALIQDRIALRTDHFMPVSLLASQYKDLEIPTGALIVDVSHPVCEIVEEIIASLEPVFGQPTT